MSLTWIWPLDGPDGGVDECVPFTEVAGVLAPLVRGAEEPEEEEEPAEPGCLEFVRFGVGGCCILKTGACRERLVVGAAGRGVAEGVKGPNWDIASGPLTAGEAGQDPRLSAKRSDRCR